MQEKDLTQKLYGMFEAVITALENVSNGFLTQNQALLQKGEKQFLDVLSSNLEFAETIVKNEKKSEADEKFIGLLIPLQEIALAVRNLISKEKAILQRNVLFSVKAVMEITDLLKAMKQQFIDTKDYIFTKNPTLKENVKSGKDKIIKMADEYALMHEGRLIAGICGTKASYLYLSLIGSIKTVAKELVSFSERI